MDEKDNDTTRTILGVKPDLIHDDIRKKGTVVKIKAVAELKIPDKRFYAGDL